MGTPEGNMIGYMPWLWIERSAVGDSGAVTIGKAFPRALQHLERCQVCHHHYRSCGTAKDRHIYILHDDNEAVSALGE
jgi:hypothetical protein